MATSALSALLGVYLLAALCMTSTRAESTNGTCNGVKGLCAVPLSLASFAGTHNSASYNMRLETNTGIDLGALTGVVDDQWENQDVGIRVSLEAGIRALDMDASYMRVSEEEAMAMGTALLGSDASLDEVASVLGARSSDGGVCVASWAHCSTDDICAFSNSGDRADTIPLAAFESLGGFLDANQDAIIILGLSDLFAGPWRDVCPGTDDLKLTIMRSLGRSSLFRHVARQEFAPNATLQSVIDSGRRALVITYDGWGRDARFEIMGSDGSKATVGSQLFQRLTATSSPDGLNDDGTVRRQMAQELLPRVSEVIDGSSQGGLPVDTLRVLSYSPNQCQYCTSKIISGIQNIGSDVINKVVEGSKDAANTVYDGAKNVAQDAASAVSGGVGTAIDKVQDVAGTVGEGAGDAVDAVKDFFGGLFGRKLLVVDDAATCGYIACAPGSNEKAHLLYIQYKASTTGVQDTSGLLPRFNVFQVNYFDVPSEGVVQTVQQLNSAWAAQYAQEGSVNGPLTTCAWVADNSEFKAQIACLNHGEKKLGLSNLQEAFLPKNLALVGVRGGSEVGTVCGGATGSRVSAEALQSAFGGSIEAMRATTC